MQQQYKVNNTVFNNIEEATAHVSKLNKAVTISPYTAPTVASKKLNVARNMLVREMLEWVTMTQGTVIMRMATT